MGIRKGFVRAIGVTLAAGMALLAGAGAASAAPTGCASGYMCLWKDVAYETNGSSYNEAAFEFYHTNFRYWGAWTGVNYVNDKASSVYNNGRLATARLYVNSGFSGSSFSLVRGTGDSNIHDAIGTVPYPSFADELSSGCFSDWC